jgi:iron complex outermembrane recepter protein
MHTAGRLVSPDKTGASLLVAAALISVPAEAAQALPFNVSPGPLGQALVAFGEQAGMSVGLNDATLARRHSQGARGRMSHRQALRQILAGTGARVIEIDARTVRVEVAITPARPKPVVPRAPRPMANNPHLVFAEIVVTASKQNIPLRNYAGTVSILDLDANALASEAAQGTAAVVSRLPVLASTNLGPGRNKIFIRGVADSSFNGSSAATVGQYLGDVRLTYNAPDPALNLYDMQGVEVLEGPQGTLYGAGAIGGIIRLVATRPNLNDHQASMAVGVVSVAHGDQGYDSAGVINWAAIPGTAALRAVAYSSKEPGYIDDPLRGLSNINRTLSHGGRAALRVKPGGGWDVTIGGAIQNIASRDGQYSIRGVPALERRSVLSQPFDNDYSLGYLTAAGNIRGTQLTSTTSVVRHDVDTVYDATLGEQAPRLFTENLAIRLFSHETRLSRSSADESWVVGISGLTARDRTTRALGDPASPAPVTGVRNVNNEAAIFGQYSRTILSDVTATVGGRLSYTHSKGEVIDDAFADAAEPRRSQTRFSPTLAVAWRVNGELLAYVHGQSAFRPGNLEVAPTGSAIDAQRIEPDTLSAIEAGLRYGEKGRDRLTFATSIAASRWTDIQSDLVDSAGLPFTTNVGDGRTLSFEAEAAWAPIPPLLVEASLFLNDSQLIRPAPSLAAADERDLPNIPHLGARIAASYAVRFDARTRLTVNGSLRYVGASRLGIGDPLDLAQGRYVNASIGARLSRGPVGLSLDIANLADARGNRFAFGNPFGVASGDQITPMVPRRVRIGIDARF